MSTKNCTDSSSVRTPDNVLCDFVKTIKTDRGAAESSKKAKKTSRQSKETARRFKICTLDRAQETHEIYQDLLSCVTLEQYKKSETIQTNVGDYIKKDDEIDKLLVTSSDSINELCKKLVEANSELCKMTDCLNNIIFSKTKKNRRKGKKDIQDKADEIEDCIEDIKDTTGKLKGKGENAVEAIKSIGGIHTFTNTKSLEESAKALFESITDLKKSNEDNIGSSEKEVETYRAELNTIVEELSVIMCEEASFNTQINGLDIVKEFICETPCDGECFDACEEYEECMESSCGGDHDDDNNSKGKQMVDQN